MTSLGPHERPPCNCLRCQAAGVTHLNVRVVPNTVGTGAHEAHGEELREWYAGRERFLAFKGDQAIDPFGLRTPGRPPEFQRLREREPGEDDE